MKKKTFLLIFSFVLLLIVSCNDSKLNPNRKNIICLIDFSGSIKKKKMKDYAEGISYILKSMGPEDKLVAYPIDAGSLIDRVTMIYEDFRHADKYSGTTFKNLNMPDSVGPPFKKKDEDDFTAYNKMPKRIDEYLNFVYPLIKPRLDSIKADRKKYEGKSDIFSALYSVKNDLVNNDTSLVAFADKKTTNIVIIFSDMVQDSEDFSFEKKRLEPKSYSKFMTSLKENGLLPNLKKTKIIICDNYSDTKISTNSLAKKRIIDFWENYFLDSLVNANSHIDYLNTGNMDELVSIIRAN